MGNKSQAALGRSPLSTDWFKNGGVVSHASAGWVLREWRHPKSKWRMNEAKCSVVGQPYGEGEWFCAKVVD